MVFASGFPVGPFCSVPGCGERAVAKGLCRSHYNRRYYSGHPLKPNLSRLCPQCMEYFAPSRKDQAFCSGRCRTAYCRAHAADPVAHPLRPRTPVFDNTVELAEPVRVATPTMMFTLDDVWRHCGGRCAVCGEPVDLGLPAVSPLGAEAVWRVDPTDGGVPCLENRLIIHHACRAVMAGVVVRRQAGGGETVGRSGKKVKQAR